MGVNRHVSGCSMLVGILSTSIQHLMGIQHHDVCSKYPTLLRMFCVVGHSEYWYSTLDWYPAS